MAGSTYVGVGCIAFLVCLGVQFAGWARYLRTSLRSADPTTRRRAIGRWARFAVGYQVLVLVGVGVYLVAASGSHGPGRLWPAPAVGAVMGAALPLQLAAVSISRAAR